MYQKGVPQSRTKAQQNWGRTRLGLTDSSKEQELKIISDSEF